MKQSVKQTMKQTSDLAKVGTRGLVSLLLALCLLFMAVAGHADDTEIYYSNNSGGSSVNLMFLFDTSGSMNYCRTSHCSYNEETRIKIMKDVFSQLMDGMGSNINVGVGAFSGSTTGANAGGGSPGYGGYVGYPVRNLDASVNALYADSTVNTDEGDGYQTKGTTSATWDSGNNGLDFPADNAANTGSGLLFRHVKVPSYAIITDAYITVDPTADSSTPLAMYGYYANGDDLPDLAQQDLASRNWGPINSVTNTVQGVPINITGPWSKGQKAKIDVTDLIKSVVEDASWCGNEDLLLSFVNQAATDTNSRPIGTNETTVDNGVGYAPASLHIDWDLNPNLGSKKSCKGGIVKSIDASDDDAEQHTNGQVDTNAKTITLKDGTSGGFRFTDVNYPSSYTIKNAVLHLPGAGSAGVDSVCKYYIDTNYNNGKPDWLGKVSDLSGKQAPPASFTCGEDITWQGTKKKCHKEGSGNNKETVCEDVPTTNTYHTGSVASSYVDIPQGKNVTLHVSVLDVGSSDHFRTSKNNISQRAEVSSKDYTVPADTSAFGKTIDLDVTSLVNSVISGNPNWDGSDKSLAFKISVKNLPDAGDEFYISTRDNHHAASLTLQVASPNMSDFVQTVRDQLKQAVNKLSPNGGTPLGESYTEMARYMMGMGTYFGNGSGYSHAKSNPASTKGGKGKAYISPIAPKAQSCATNAIIIMTDGVANQDAETGAQVKNVSGKTCQYFGNGSNNFGSDAKKDYACMAKLAGWLNDGKANLVNRKVSTNIVGFYLTKGGQIMNHMKGITQKGGGQTLQADSADTLLQAFNTIIDSTIDENATMAAPGVAVNQLNRMEYLNQLYYAVFKPGNTSVWPGNLKKYKLDYNNGDPQIVGANGDNAIDPNTGFFSKNVRSFWSQVVDGNDVGKGGALEHLKNHDTQHSWARRLFITTAAGGIGTDPTAAAVRTTDNSKVSEVDSASELNPEQVGFQSNNASNNNDRNAIYDWLMDAWGDPLHAEPTLVNFGFSGGDYAAAADDPTKQENVIFVSENDGLLHAISALTGEELFAFSPKEELVKDKNRYQIDSTGNPRLPSTHKRNTYGLDGTWTFWRRIDSSSIGTVNSVYAYGGERRGGHNYYALDVTKVGYGSNNPDPKLMWQITPATNATTGEATGGGSGPFSILGQTWSQPQMAKVRINGNPVPVLVFGGGYDPAEDTFDPTTGDAQGHAIYMVNALTGALVWYASDTQLGTNGNFGFTKVDDMKWSIPAKPTVVDVNGDGYADFIYVGDMHGQVFRVDLNNFNNAGLDSSKPLVADVVTLAKLGANGTGDKVNNRRFYAPPAVVLGERNGQRMLQVVIGSGYRSHPLLKGSGSAQNYAFELDDTMALPTLAAINGGTYDPNDTSGVGNQPTLTLNDLFAIGSVGSTVDIDDASTYGWKLKLDKSIGEKSMSAAFVIQGEVVFSTYTAEINQKESTKCSTVAGSARLYRVGLNTAEPMKGNKRFEEINVPGIPPKPQVIVTGPGEAGSNNGNGNSGKGGSVVCAGTYCDIFKDMHIGDVQPIGWYQSTESDVEDLFDKKKSQ